MRRISGFFKSEIAKLKEMNFTEKRQYLWEYYKLHLAVFIVLGVVVYGLLDTWVFNPSKDEVIHIAWMAEYETDENFGKITELLDALLVTDPDKEKSFITSFAPTGNAEFDMAKTQQFTALLSAGDLDVFVVGGLDDVMESAPMGIISPVDATTDLLKTTDPALYERIAPALREMKFVTEDGLEVTGVYAIPLADAPFLNSLGLFSKDLYLCVSVTTDKIPAVVKTLQLFYADE